MAAYRIRLVALTSLPDELSPKTNLTLYLEQTSKMEYASWQQQVKGV